MVIRRSSRAHIPPSWLKNYVTCANKNPTSHVPRAYPYITPNIFSSSYSNFLCAVTQIHEPQSFEEAHISAEWQDAMKQELMALERNKTWELVSQPPGKRPIDCKWIYKVKLKVDGSVERFKARLVAKGYTQVEGVDFFDNFFAAAKTVTIRILLALAAQNNWLLHQCDVNNAFLHGYLDEELYMTPPLGYPTQDGQVCRLKRSIYGLKQASRQWNKELTTKLKVAGFAQSHHDNCLFVKGTGSDLIILLVYVDDLLLASPSLAAITEIKNFLDKEFSIKDLGEAKFFLGLEIARSSSGMYVNQRKYALDLLNDFGLLGAKATTTPIFKNQKFDACSATKLEDPEKYRRLIGRLLYLGFTRPILTYAT